MDTSSYVILVQLISCLFIIGIFSDSVCSDVLYFLSYICNTLIVRPFLVQWKKNLLI